MTHPVKQISVRHLIPSQSCPCEKRVMDVFLISVLGCESPRYVISTEGRNLVSWYQGFLSHFVLSK